MLKFKYNRLINHFNYQFSTSTPKNVKVSLCGGTGGIGQPLALLLKRSPLITKLTIYDIVNVAGVTKDLSHVDTNCEVKGFEGPEHLKEALCDIEIVVLLAGATRKPGMSRDDLFIINANIVKVIGEACAEYCPKAFIAVVSNPVNSMVPLVGEIFKQKGVFDEKKLFGVTTLDVVRAKTFIAEIVNVKPECVKIDVVGGHSGVTIVPIFSRAIPRLNLSDEELIKLTKRVQNAGTEVVEAKAGKGSATLSTAHAVAEFTFSLCRAKDGEANVVECTYVHSCATAAEYFSTPVLLGKEGIKENFGVGKLSILEEDEVKKAVSSIKANVDQGKKFLKDTKKKCG